MLLAETDTVKKRIGQRIRQIRNEKKLSREALCEDESQLSVRQLARIEQGYSLPTLVKIGYIASMLEVDVSHLLKKDSLTIPEDYFELKYQLIKFPSYGDPKRMAQKVEMLERIHRRYFEILPEDELFTLELLENIQEHRMFGNSGEAELIFDDYFKQLLTKKDYNTNDLLLASYYIIQCISRSYDEKALATIIDQVFHSPIKSDDYYNFVLLGALSAIADFYLYHHQYDRLKELIDKMNDIVEGTRQHSSKPIVALLEAKYCIVVESNAEKAKELYDLAIMLARVFGDVILEKTLKQERERERF